MLDIRHKEITEPLYFQFLSTGLQETDCRHSFNLIHSFHFIMATQFFVTGIGTGIGKHLFPQSWQEH